MANTEEKTGNFLKAIQKYADEQKHQIESEVELFKKEELKKAEEEGLKDAYALIQKEMASKKISITRQTAKDEAESKKELYAKRIDITSNVFESAFNELCKYTLTDSYKEQLKKTATDMAKVFNGQDLIVSIKPQDDGLKGDISACFNGCNISIKTDNHIKIGGLAVYCENQGVYIDKTLDTKLSDQKEWFFQNSNLEIS